MKVLSVTKLVAKAAFLVTMAFSIPAQADLTMTLLPGPGTVLSNIHIGDIVTFNTYGNSSDVGEVLTDISELHILGTGPISFVSGFLQPTWNSPLETNPLLVIWTLEITGYGNINLWNGFPGGDAFSNLGQFHPDDSNHVRFAVAVPEPETYAMMLAGLGLLGYATRRRNKKAA